MGICKQYSNDGKTNISHLAYIIANVKIGNNTFIGPFTLLDGGGGLEIVIIQVSPQVYKFIAMILSPER